jgi:hypothetical protein
MYNILFTSMEKSKVKEKYASCNLFVGNMGDITGVKT